MLRHYLPVIIAFFLIDALTAKAWRVKAGCFICDSIYSFRAGDLIDFSFYEVPKNISGFDIYLAYGTSKYDWVVVSTIARNVDALIYYGHMPNDVFTSNQYYFIIDSIGSYESRATIGPLDVLSKYAVDPYAKTTTTTTTTYRYTTTSSTHIPTSTRSSQDDDDSEEYQSQLHALYIGRIVGSVVGSVIALAIIIGGFFYMRRRNKCKLDAQQEHQRDLVPPQPIMMRPDGSPSSSPPPGTPPITQMMAMPIPAHEQPHESPQPGYYYAMLTPPQQPSATHISATDSNPHLSMPIPPQHGSYIPDSSNVSMHPLQQQQQNNNYV